MSSEPDMPPSAYLALEAHETRLQNLERDSRDSASKVADHDADIDHLKEMLDVKMSDVRKDISQVHTNVDGLGKKIDGLSEHIGTVATQIAQTAGRLEKLEQHKAAQDHRWKWILGAIGTLAVGGIGVAIQQFIEHFFKR